MKLHFQYDFSPVQAYRFGYSPIGTPSLYVYVYFIDGLLIDAGFTRMRKEITQILDPLPVNQLLITHHHEDHSGNSYTLQNHFQCPAYASPLCIELLKKPKRLEPPRWIYWGSPEATTSLIPVKDIITTPNYTFQVILIPGHAADQIGLYEANQGWFFSADLYLNDYIRYFMYPESMKDQIQSLKRVLKLDFNKLFCGHNPQLKRPKKRLRNKLKFLEDFYGKVADLYHQGYSPKAIMTALELQSMWSIRLFSLGQLSALNMVRSVIRDEKRKENS